MTTLTVGEMMVLAGNMEHAPSCVWSQPVSFAYRDDAGGLWEDAAFTIPHEWPACTCGYFATLDAGRDKLRAELAAHGVRL